ncbi:MAG: adenylosuccinate lyase family protein, partial [Nioella sp.]
VMGAAKGLALAADLAEGLAVQAGAMADRLHDPLGLIHAEALSFALAAQMPRPAAQAAVKAACKEAMATGTPLPALLAAAHPGLELGTVIDTAVMLGDAPAEARAFAAAVEGRGTS